jgi:hypothetical protein
MLMLWVYFNAEGVVIEAASKKGRSCIRCHSQNANSNYMVMRKYFP